MSTTTLDTSGPHEYDGPEESARVLPLRRANATGPGSTTTENSTDHNDGRSSPVMGPVLDAELVEDDEPGAGPVAVDPPDRHRGDRSMAARLHAYRSGSRRPVLAPWLRSRAELAAAARWAATHAAHTSAYHAARSPLYAARLAARSPRGALRTVVAAGRWVADAEGAPLRLTSVGKGDAETYLKLVKVRQDRVRLRWRLAAVAAVVLVAAGLVVHWWAPVWSQLLLAGALVAALGWVGTPADKPIVGRAVVTQKAQRLTSDIVVRALGALGISLINQALSKGSGITFPSPIQRDGPGWRAEVDLPYGVTAVDIIEKRRELASGLRRPLGCVWPEPVDDEHAGRLVLWVGDQDMSKARQPAWPLRKAGSVDLFKPVPFGTDQRGRWVTLTLMFTSAAIGAIPRMGKTFALRELLLIAALDPRAQVHAYDLKGTGDLSPLECIAHRYRSGDDPDDLDYGLADMRELQAELRRRAKVIRELPRHLCPEYKVTPELASNRRYGLWPIVIGVDECQRWFEHPKHGKELEEICTDLVRRGPALGIMLILATQRPDAKSLPTGISANVSTRFCLKVMGQTENDMVLGTSQYKNGVRASMFAWKDKGIGYLVGEGSDARIVRTVYLDGPESEAIARRARTARETAGLLTGHAIGQGPDDLDRVRVNVAQDAAGVFTRTEDKLWSETILARLAEQWPDRYAGWTPNTLAAALKPHGVRPEQVWAPDGDGVERNRRGYTLTALTTAASSTESDDAEG
jgi:DNA segregation ATPase FtsK/SpoIIIE, S-DNA-T family